MKFSLVSVAHLLLVCALSSVSSTQLLVSKDVDQSLYTFEQYEVDFDKKYDSKTERDRRKAIFQDNMRRIHHHNSQSSNTHTLGINHLMDLVSHELPMGYDKSFHPAWHSSSANNENVASHGQKPDFPHGDHQLDLPFEIESVDKLPTQVNWHGYETPVKNQGWCGSCWAFASTAALETHVAIQTGTLYTLSVQELVSCVDNPRDCGGEGGCTGATASLAMDFVATSGIVDEWQFGYTSYHGETPKCPFNFTTPRALRKAAPTLSNEDASTGVEFGGAVAKIEGYASIPTNNYTATMNALAKMGPLVVAVACTNWHLYHGGVFTDTDKSPRAYDINHAVVLTGYGTDEETGEDYWIIRNSWGPRWGEDGYIRLKRVNPATLKDLDCDCDCGMDVTPKHGDACTKNKDGNPITPPAVKVCGTGGVLFDPVLPLGSHLT